MKLLKVPSLLPILIISDNPRLIAKISALIAKNGSYVPVLDGPRMLRIDSEADVIRRNNAAARFQPKKIILADLEDNTANLFIKRFPKDVVNRVTEASQINTKNMGNPVRTGTPLIWGNNNIGIGLLKALRMKVPIEFSDIETNEKLVKVDNGHLVVCEDGDDHAQVIAANYAYSLEASLLIINSIDKDEAASICEEFYGANERQDISPSEVLSRLKNRLRSLVGEISLSGVTGITFISDEVPYGFAFPEVPTTHLFIYPDLGISIINAMAAEQKNSPPMRVAAVIDPKKLPSTEAEEVAINMADRGMLVRGYRGHMASVSNISKMLELLPYDFLLIATHCGDVKGWRETYEFTDSEGRPRKLVVDTAIHVASTSEEDMLEVMQFQNFVSLDDIDWNDKEKLKTLPVGTAIIDFTSKRHAFLKPVHKKEINRVPNSAALQMHDGNLIIAPKAVADNLTPIILNNACVSWHRLASTFVFCSARAYIGTLFSVSGIEAEEMARKITKKYFGKPLAVALWHAQNEIYDSGVRRPYIMVGVHYQKLNSKYEDVRGYLVKRFARSLNYWNKQLEFAIQSNEDQILSLRDKVDFLKWELESIIKLHRAEKPVAND